MNKKAICGSNGDQSEVIAELKEKMLSDDDSYKLAEFFKVYGDSTRVKIINLLNNREICVHEIASILEMSQSAISHQLKILRHYQLVKPRKEGKHVFYSLSDDHVIQIFNNGLEHINE